MARLSDRISQRRIPPSTPATDPNRVTRQIGISGAVSGVSVSIWLRMLRWRVLCLLRVGDHCAPAGTKKAIQTAMILCWGLGCWRSQSSAQRFRPRPRKPCQRVCARSVFFKRSCSGARRRRTDSSHNPMIPRDLGRGGVYSVNVTIAKCRTINEPESVRN
jgi:hypothetical protein